MKKLIMLLLVAAVSLGLASVSFAAELEKRKPTVEEMTGVFVGQLKLGCGHFENVIFVAYPRKDLIGLSKNEVIKESFMHSQDLVFYAKKSQDPAAYNKGKITDADIAALIAESKKTTDAIEISIKGSAEIFNHQIGASAATLKESFQTATMYAVTVKGETMMLIEFVDHGKTAGGLFSKIKKLSPADVK